MEAGPDILNHNVETVERLQKPVRKRARYDRSLRRPRRRPRRWRSRSPVGRAPCTRSRASWSGSARRARSSRQTFRDLRAVDCDILTIGQYLRPTAGAPARRALRPPRRVRGDEGRGAGARLQARRVGAARALLVPRPRPGARGGTAKRSSTAAALAANGILAGRPEHGRADRDRSASWLAPMSLRDLAPRLERRGRPARRPDSWDADRQVWNLAVDQRPIGIVWPRDGRRRRRDRPLRRRSRAADRVQRGRPQRRDDRLGRRHAAAEDRAHGGHQHRSGGRRARVEAGVLAQTPRPGRRRARPRVSSPGPRPTSACSATRSAAASAGWSAATGWPATRSRPPMS